MAKATVYSNVTGLRKALRQLPKHLTAELRDASQDIAREVADEARGKAEGLGGAARIVAPTIRAGRDRVPVIKMGSAKRIRSGTDSQKIGNLIFGAEFGGGARPMTMQFSPHKGTDGYFLWETIRDNKQDIHDRHSAALAAALKRI